MNALNLRLSSVKTNENVKKNAEMRASLVKLPEQYEKCKGLCDKKNTSRIYKTLNLTFQPKQSFVWNSKRQKPYQSKWQRQEG